MTDQKDQIKNILDLPNEILGEIFRYVPDHSDLMLACKRFHHVSCATKFFCLDLNLLSSEGFLQFSMSTTRRFNVLKKNCAIMYRRAEKVEKQSFSNRFPAVLNRFGKDVKVINIGCYCFELSLVPFLHLLPKLEEISLTEHPRSHFTRDLTSLDDFPSKLNIINDFIERLPKLRKLYIYLVKPYGSYDFREGLNCENLKKLDIHLFDVGFGTRSPPDDLQKLFRHCRNLEELRMKYSMDERTSDALVQSLPKLKRFACNRGGGGMYEIYKKCI